MKTFESWYEKGSIKSSRKYKEGKLIDTMKTWYLSGNLKHFEVYDQEGNELRSVSYYENGVKSFERTVINSKYGKYKTKYFNEKGEKFKNKNELNKKKLQQEIRRHIHKNYTFTEALLDSNISGKVYVRFTITPEGTVKDISAYTTVHPYFEEEGKRIMKSFKTSPKTIHNLEEDIVFSVPISFQAN